MYGPVCDFESQIGERHQWSPIPALLEPCEPVVDESGGSGKAQVREKRFHLYWGERWLREGREKAEKEKKQAQEGLQRQRIKARDWPR